MVRHIVFWNLKDFAEGADKKANALILKTKLESLVGEIEGLLKAEVNENYNPNGYDLCLYSEFTDKAALDYYQNHMKHLEIREFVKKIILDRAVSDSEIV